MKTLIKIFIVILLAIGFIVEKIIWGISSYILSGIDKEKEAD